MNRIAVGTIAALLIAGLSVLAWQRQVQERLRNEISALRQWNSGIERLSRKNQRLAASLAPPAELDGLRNDQRQLERLKVERAALAKRFELQAALRFAPGPGQPPKPLAPGMMPLGNLANAGTGTPGAAAQTFFWAVAQADLDAMASQLVFSEASRAKAEKLWAALDDETRRKMVNPEKMMAYYFVGLLGRVAGVQVLSQEFQGADRAAWNVKLQTVSGRLNDFDLPVQRSAEGWREEVPERMVDLWSHFLLRTR
jgi:hypothetical protein